MYSLLTDNNDSETSRGSTNDDIIVTGYVTWLGNATRNWNEVGRYVTRKSQLNWKTNSLPTSFQLWQLKEKIMWSYATESSSTKLNLFQLIVAFAVTWMKREMSALIHQDRHNFESQLWVTTLYRKWNKRANNWTEFKKNRHTEDKELDWNVVVR